MNSTDWRKQIRIGIAEEERERDSNLGAGDEH